MPRRTPFVTGNTLSVGNKSHTGQYDVWRPELCDEIQPLAAQGWSIKEICHELGFSHDSWARWQEEHPEWREAVLRAKSAAEAWWIRYAREHLILGGKQRFQERNYALVMMNQFGWNKKEEQTIKGDLAETLKTMYDRLKKSDSPSTSSAND